MNKQDKLSSELLRQVIHYEPETGVFTRIKASWSRPDTTGVVANKGNSIGYRQISINGIQYQEHRLAWLYMTGSWPMGQIDHLNGDGKDNRWSNLRDVCPRTNAENQRKARSDNGLGILGVYPNKKRFMAKISYGGKKNVYLGTFDTPKQAHEAYLEAKRKYHAGCTI